MFLVSVLAVSKVVCISLRLASISTAMKHLRREHSFFLLSFHFRSRITPIHPSFFASGTGAVKHDGSLRRGGCH